LSLVLFIDVPQHIIDDLTWLAKLKNKSQKQLIAEVLINYVKENEKLLAALKKMKI